jgi:1-acyl-sn-glycerol-3-phosphate acyltransferase
MLKLYYYTYCDANCFWGPQQKKYTAQHAINIAFKLFVFALENFGLMHFEFRNFDKLQSDNGCLLISNHPTLIDYVLIISKLKHCTIIVKEKLWRNFFVKKLIQLAGYIPNTNFAETSKLIQESLRRNDNVLIFPEGTRTTQNKPLHLKRGVSQVAIRSGAPIRIIKINCNPSTLTKQNKWYHIPPRKAFFILEVNKLIDSSAFLQDTNITSLAARRLTKYLQSILEKA